MRSAAGYRLLQPHGVLARGARLQYVCNPRRGAADEARPGQVRPPWGGFYFRYNTHRHLKKRTVSRSSTATRAVLSLPLRPARRGRVKRRKERKPMRARLSNSPREAVSRHQAARGTRGTRGQLRRRGSPAGPARVSGAHQGGVMLRLERIACCKVNVHYG